MVLPIVNEVIAISIHESQIEFVVLHQLSLLLFEVPLVDIYKGGREVHIPQTRAVRVYGIVLLEFFDPVVASIASLTVGKHGKGSGGCMVKRQGYKRYNNQNNIIVIVIIISL